ncbi:YIP1 family protein [Pelagibacteraceae bacterium]|nr:YIP1 family protein [Pelagibacteraceae bacterium]
MISIFFNRVYRSIKIDPDVYDEVQKDKNATLSAAIVVVVSSLAAGMAAKQLGASSFILAPILSLVSWFVWAYIVYFVGVKLFPDAKTKTSHAALLRAIGFSSAPGIIRVFGFTPELMTVTFVGSALWMLACMVVAVRQTLNFKSLWKALGVVIMSWFVQAFALISVMALIRNF